MPRFRRPRGRTALRAGIAAVAAAVAAVALGAMHGNAASPATQSVTVPNKRDKPSMLPGRARSRP